MAKLRCISQWKERIEFDHLRCGGCFKLRDSEIDCCCHCGHAPGEQPKRENFLPTDEKIRIVHIGECDDLSMWFRELYDVEGNLYRLHHRCGIMYAFRVDDDFVVFDRKQGGPYDGADSNQEVLQQTADVFELVDRGTHCYLCQAVYPDDAVPVRCYVCATTLRAEVWQLLYSRHWWKHASRRVSFKIAGDARKTIPERNSFPDLIDATLDLSRPGSEVLPLPSGLARSNLTTCAVTQHWNCRRRVGAPSNKCCRNSK